MAKPIGLYERTNNIELPTSASWLPSNLAVLHLNENTYAGVVHKGEFVIACVSKEEHTIVGRVIPKLSPQQMILQGSWIWDENPLLVLVTTSTIQIFDWDGGILLHTHIPKCPTNNCGSSSLKGIAGLPSGRICIGAHTGEVLVLNLKDSDNLAFVEECRLKWFSSQVVALKSRDKTLVAASANGEIMVAVDQEELKEVAKIEPPTEDTCITCIDVLEEVVITGYTSGHIRIFHLLSGVLKAEVCAHARSVSCLDIAKNSGMLLSCSEDTFVRVWKLDSTSQTLIEHKYSQSAKDFLLVGGRFSNDEGSEFLLAAYDAAFLLSFKV